MHTSLLPIFRPMLHERPQKIFQGDKDKIAFLFLDIGGAKIKNTFLFFDAGTAKIQF